MVLVWECDNPELSRRHLQKEFIPYAYYIVFDLEDVFRRRNLGLTLGLKIVCSHIPITVAINDSLTEEPIFIESRDPWRLIQKFVAELTHRERIILREVWNNHPMTD